jgi:hypothetical protein
MCGHSADGAEWTKRIPLVPAPSVRVAVRAVTVTSFISGVSYAFPSGLAEVKGIEQMTAM